MDKRLKMIVIGLGVILLLSLAFSFWTLMSRTQMVGDYEVTKDANDKLKKENKSLKDQIAAIINEKSQAIQRLSSIEEELDAVGKERDTLKKKYSLIQKEKESLIERLQELSNKSAIASKEGAPKTRALSKEMSDDAYWGEVLREHAQLKLRVKDLEKETSSLQVESARLQKEKENLRLEIEGLQTRRRDLVKQVDDNEKVARNISIDLVKEKKKRRELSKQIEVLEEENSSLLGQIDKMEGQIINLEEKLAYAGQETVFIDEQVEDLKEFSKEAEGILGGREQISEDAISVTRKNIVELSPIIIRPTEELMIATEQVVETEETEEIGGAIKKKPAFAEEFVDAPELISGKILSVNRDNNFVVIDLGKDNDTKLDQDFSVFRDNKKIANIKVIKIRDKVSACDIVSMTKAVKIGDIVKE